MNRSPTLVRSHGSRTASIGLAIALTATACSTSGSNSAEGSNAAYDALAKQFVTWHLKTHPFTATQLGVHDYDARIEDRSKAAIAANVARLHEFAASFGGVDAGKLSLDRQLDLDYVKGVVESQLLELEVVKSYAHDPDAYTTSATEAAFYLIKRDFAPAEQRLASLIARERSIPAFLATAKENLVAPPRILTQIALEQIDDNRGFFEHDVPLAFEKVTDPKLRSEFEAANAAVIAAFSDFKTYLNDDLLPRSNGDFVLGEKTYRELLKAQEGIDLPIDSLLAIARADLKKNQAAFVETAKKIDPSRSAIEVFEAISRQHPKPEELLATTQASLDSIRSYIVEHDLITIPKSPPATVAETPPFQRSTTSASMDTPGPYEKGAREAYYFMTLPDPTSGPEDVEEFMRQWYVPMISNVSVHEAYPGHYIQFLYADSFPSDIRKVFGANTNIEGWAHYCETMMLDQGFHADDPAYRLAQLQDALLRDARFVVGISMHTRGMTIEEAEKFFEKEAYQPAPVAISESKRGTTDALYGYYTLGKLMILKLRDDYFAAHPKATLREFHDAFIRLGPLPIPSIRRAMLGSTGAILPPA